MAEDGNGKVATVTLTQEDLDARITAAIEADRAKAQRDAEGDDVKQVRAIVREEAAEAVRAVLSEVMGEREEPKGGAPEGQERKPGAIAEFLGIGKG